MSLSAFADRFERRAQQVITRTNEIKRTAALAIDQAVVRATPVDTGRARSNYIVTTDAQSSVVRPPFAAGEGLGISETANAQAAIAEAARVISGVRPGQAIFITNNLPYISQLNNGSSAQAPAMFVQLAVMEGLQAIQSERIFNG